MSTTGQGQQGLGTVWDSAAMKYVPIPQAYDPGFGQSLGVSEEMWNTYTPEVQNAVVDSAKNLGYTPPTQTETPGLGGWFKDNKDMIGAGLGAAQLGLGILNFNQNKKALKSDLASAEQARRLNEERAQNKRTIQNKAQTALRFDI